MEHSAPTPLAHWNTARDVWEVPQTEGLFCEHLAVFSETFPTSGSMRSGTVYESPTSADATDDSACSYLPTPRSSDRNGSGEHGTGGPDLRTVITRL